MINKSRYFSYIIATGVINILAQVNILFVFHTIHYTVILRTWVFVMRNAIWKEQSCTGHNVLL